MEVQGEWEGGGCWMVAGKEVNACLPMAGQGFQCHQQQAATGTCKWRPSWSHTAFLTPHPLPKSLSSPRSLLIMPNL